MSRKLLGELIAPDAMRQRAHLTHKGNVKSRRHGWLRLTPAYSLHVVETILKSGPDHQLVLDPFSGTGTTPLVSACLGHQAHSVDVNPFLVWLGNLKTTQFSDDVGDAIRAEAARLVANLRRRKSWKRAWVPDLHQIEKWWDEPTLEALSHLFRSIGRVETDAESTTDLLKVAFCRASIEVSQASFNHQSMSFKKRADDAQQPLFSEADAASEREAVWRCFLAAVDGIASSLKMDSPTAAARVFLGDSRDLLSALSEREYTTVITSPPYPNRMSYIRELRPYMYWLGYLTNGRQAGELDWQAIGGTWGCATSNLGTWEPDPSVQIAYKRFDSIVEAITKDHKLLGPYVHKYFEDIKVHLQSLRTIMAPGARCYYVVGNSKFYDTMLPVEEIYAALLADSGFEAPRVEKIRKRNSKKELFEFVVHADIPD